MRNGFSQLIILISIVLAVSAGVGVSLIRKGSKELPRPTGDGGRATQTPYAQQSLSPLPSVTPTPTSILSSTPIPTLIVKPCIVGGCSGELCSPKNQEGLASICIALPESACYKKTRCEIQSNGVCGWTQTSEFAACIKGVKATPMPSTVLCNPPVECAVPPAWPRCYYTGGSTCACGKLVCEALSPTPVLTSPPPSIPTPSQSPGMSPLSSPVSITEVQVEADDLGFYPTGQVSFLAGTRVKLTFSVRTARVYYGGLDFRSSKFSTVKALPGKTVTVEFTADSSFVITSYWPSSGVYKASLSVNVQ
ncbi:MAG: hypothetical protein AAB972_04810 [Patescibacteria group bacterium]